MPIKSIVHAASVGPQPPLANVAVLLYGNGSVNGVTFKDNSIIAATFTKGGTITTQLNPNTPPSNQTDYNQFDATSIYTPMTGYLKAPDNGAYELTQGAFTIEAFIYPLSYGNSPDAAAYGTGVWMDTRQKPSNGGNYQGVFLNFAPTSHAPQICLGYNYTFVKYAGTTTIPLNKWSHVAFVRYADRSGAIYLNGVKDATITFPVITNFLNQGMTIGQDVDANNSFAFDGYINQIRLTNGVAVYSGNTYPVPRMPFPPASP